MDCEDLALRVDDKSTLLWPKAKSQQSTWQCQGRRSHCSCVQRGRRVGVGASSLPHQRRSRRLWGLLRQVCGCRDPQPLDSEVRKRPAWQPLRRWEEESHLWHSLRTPQVSSRRLVRIWHKPHRGAEDQTSLEERPWPRLESGGRHSPSPTRDIHDSRDIHDFRQSCRPSLSLSESPGSIFAAAAYWIQSSDM